MSALSRAELPPLDGSTWDAVVVGAGVAGALAARSLALAGKSVLLVDKAPFPRYKICGCCLNLRAVAQLDSAGLRHVLEHARAVPLHAVYLAAGGRAAMLPLPGGYALSRAALDNALAQAAVAAGARFLPGQKATLHAPADDASALRLQPTTPAIGPMPPIKLHARVILAADGLHGRLLRQSGGEAPQIAADSRIGAGAIASDFDAFYKPGVIYMACGKHGYTGLVVLEDGSLDIAAALDAAAVREAGLPGAVHAILEQAGLPVPAALEALAWRGTPALTRRAPRLTTGRVLAIGDAAGYIEPFTGEGMAWAMASALAVAPLALEVMEERAMPAGPAALGYEACWRAAHTRSVASRQWPCKLLAHALRRPRLMRMGIAMLALQPRLARPLVQYLNSPVPAPSRRAAT